MKNIQFLCENIELMIHNELYLRYDGSFVFKKNKRRAINNIFIPDNIHLRAVLINNLAKLVRGGIAKMSDKILLTCNNQFVKRSDKVVDQIQRGGYNISGNIASSKRRLNANNQSSLKRYKRGQLKRQADNLVSNTSKKQKFMQDIDDFYNQELFQLVNVEYNLTFITYFTDETRYHRVRGFLRNVVKIQVEYEVEQVGQRYCQKQLYDTHIHKTEIKANTVPDQVPELIHQRMYGVALNYNYLQVEENSSSSSECVYQYLLSHYQPYLKKLTKEYLLELFQEFDSSEGVSTYQIIKFCERFKVPLYALDLELQVFHHYKPLKQSHKLPALVYVCCNSHLYPIDDQSLRQSIFAKERESSCLKGVPKYKLQQKKHFNDNPVVINPKFEDISSMTNVNVVFTNLTTLMPLVLFFYQTEHTIYKTNSFNNIVTKLEYKDGVTVHLNADYHTAREDCLALSIPFKNQNQITLSKEVFEIYVQGDKVYSSFNSEVNKVFFDYQKGPFVFSNSIPENSNGLISYDIKKCYSASLSVHNHSEWSIFSIFDEIRPYSGKLRTGFFFVESSNFFPLKGSGWYSKSMLEYCSSIGIPFKVKFEIIPSYVLPADYFNALVERIYRFCPENAKFLVNSMIGNFFKKTKKSETVRFTADLNDAIRYYFSSENAVYFSHQVEGAQDLFEISIQEKHKVFDNLLPFYWQVIDNANIQVHKLAMKMGGEIISVKTDAVLVHGGQSVECGHSLGDYRMESIKLPKVVSLPFENRYSFKLNCTENWNAEPTSKAKLLVGMAGTGKSFKIKQDIKHLASYILTGTTNRASRLIGGKTVHSFLGMRDDGSIDNRQVLQRIKNLEYLIVDEVGLLNESMFEVLYYLKINSTIKLILVGDSKQLLPIEDPKYDKQRNKKQKEYFDSLVMKELVDFNKVTLVENKRSDSVMWNLFHRIDELKPSDFGNKITKRNICKTNRKRIQINEMLMKSELKAKKKKSIFIERNPEDLNSQDVRLMVGTPVMAIKTGKNLGLFNGDTFLVSKLEPLTLKDTLSKQKIEISSEIFKSYLYVNYATTCHRIQGETINEPFSIWEWNKMDRRYKYTAISRTCSKDLINVMDIEDTKEVKDIKDTNHLKLTRNLYNRKRLEDPLERKRQKSHSILMNIINNQSCPDEYSIQHTLKTRQELLEYLKIDRVIPKGYQIDHIRERNTCVTDKDFESINHFTNLRLMPAADNRARNWLK